MAGSIVAGASYRTRWQADGLSVEGPDEDPFTIGASAAERLLARPGRAARPVEALDLVGHFNPEAEYGLPELLGIAHVPVRLHGEGPSALGAAVVAAAQGREDSSALVIVADLSTSSSGTRHTGTMGIAFELTRGPGLSPLGHGGRRHPAHRAPDADAWSATGTAAGGLPESGGKGGLQLVASEAPPVLLAIWARRQPGMPASTSPSRPDLLGASPTLPTALAIRELSNRLAVGEHGLLATIHGEETSFLGFSATGPVEWVGDWQAPSGPTLSRGAVAEVALSTAVSEGAYVPRARYLENLPSRWRFVGDSCGACGAVTFPARGVCRSCRRADVLSPVELPRSGVVVATTVLAPGAQPTEFDPQVAAAGGYGVVLVEVAPGVRVTLQVADAPDRAPPIGGRVDTLLRRLYPMEGEWRYGRKAVIPSE